MEKAAIAYSYEELEAWEQDGRWTVRLGDVEATSRYLDLALAALLDDPKGAHRVAARLVAKLAVVEDMPEASEPQRFSRHRLGQCSGMTPERA